MDIVWNKSSRHRAFVRIGDELGIENDPRPEITGVIWVVTGLGSRARNNAFLAIRAALVIAFIVGVVAVVLTVDGVPALLWSIGLLLAFQFATVLSVTFHVLCADEQEIAIVRVSKFRYRVKGVDVRDVPPRGIIELRGSFPLLPDIGCYRRPEGDVFFHVARPSEDGKEWLETRFGRPLLPAPPISPQEDHRRSPWLLIAIVAAVIVVGFAIPKGASTQHFEGEGVSIDLPRGWEAYPDIDEKFPAGDDDDVQAILEQDREGLLRLAGLGPLRRVFITAIPIMPGDDAQSFADLFATDFEDDGYKIISRESLSVDGNPASAIIFEDPDEAWRTYEVLWIEGYQLWFGHWEALKGDSEALAVFRAAMETVTTESGIPES